MSNEPDDDEVLQAIADDEAAMAEAIAIAVVSRLDTVPRELRDVIRAGSQYAMPIPPVNNNYPLLKVMCDPDGIWIVFEVNSYRLYERKFFYSDRYAYPRHT